MGNLDPEVFEYLAVPLFYEGKPTWCIALYRKQDGVFTGYLRVLNKRKSQRKIRVFKTKSQAEAVIRKGCEKEECDSGFDTIHAVGRYRNIHNRKGT